MVKNSQLDAGVFLRKSDGLMQKSGHTERYHIQYDESSPGPLLRDKPIKLRVLSTKGVRTVILPNYKGVAKVDHVAVASKTMGG